MHTAMTLLIEAHSHARCFSHSLNAAAAAAVAFWRLIFLPFERLYVSMCSLALTHSHAHAFERHSSWSLFRFSGFLFWLLVLFCCCCCRCCCLSFHLSYTPSWATARCLFFGNLFTFWITVCAYDSMHIMSLWVCVRTYICSADFRFWGKTHIGNWCIRICACVWKCVRKYEKKPSACGQIYECVVYVCCIDRYMFKQYDPKTIERVLKNMFSCFVIPFCCLFGVCEFRGVHGTTPNRSKPNDVNGIWWKSTR